MPVKSYLVFPHQGKKKELESELQSISGCEVFPAQNKDLLVLVTDTRDTHEEEILIEKLSSITSLEHYTLVSGFEDPAPNEKN